MRPSFYILLLLPMVANAISQSDVDYVRDRLKELNDKVTARLQNEMRLTMSRDAPGNKPMPLRAHRTNVDYEKTSINDVNRKSKMADALYQGDIMLTRDQVDMLLQSTESRAKRQAMVPGSKSNEGDVYTLWNRTISYTYNNMEGNKTYPERHRRYIQYAIDMYEKSTCLKFKETENEGIHFVYEEGCWSYVGKYNESQELSLGEDCQSVGTAIHEIGHALGFHHTQARWDRDEHITVHFENIQEKYHSQFDKERRETNDNLGLPYDYGSVMHYDQFDTGKNYGIDIAMEAKNSLYQWTMGSYYESFYDLLMLNTLYGCEDVCANQQNLCKNGGYPNPNNCQECNCPRGFGGKLCDERPQGCGETFWSTPEWQHFSDVSGNGSSSYKYVFECNYWIKAPEGKMLEIKVDYKGGLCRGGCIHGGVEIKAQEDQRQTGYRFCCNETVISIPHLFSNHSLVPIFAYNKFKQQNVTISYRYVDKAELATIPTEVTVPAAEDHTELAGEVKTTVPAAEDHTELAGEVKTTVLTAEDHTELAGEVKTTVLAAEDHTELAGEVKTTVPAAEDHTVLAGITEKPAKGCRKWW